MYMYNGHRCFATVTIAPVAAAVVITIKDMAWQKNETKRSCKGTTRTHTHSQGGREREQSILHDKEIIREINYSFD